MSVYESMIPSDLMLSAESKICIENGTQRDLLRENLLGEEDNFELRISQPGR